MTYNSKEAEVAFRTGCEWARDKILDLVGAEIDEFEETAKAMSRSATERAMRIYVAATIEVLKKKIEGIEFDKGGR